MKQEYYKVQNPRKPADRIRAFPAFTARTNPATQNDCHLKVFDQNPESGIFTLTKLLYQILNFVQGVGSRMRINLSQFLAETTLPASSFIHN